MSMRRKTELNAEGFTVKATLKNAVVSVVVSVSTSYNSSGERSYTLSFSESDDCHLACILEAHVQILIW